MNSKKTKPWEEGEDFTHPQSKHRAKNAVLAEIEVRSNKQIKKAHAIISGVVSDLSKEKSFDDLEILSTKTKSKYRTMERSITAATSVIAGMTKSFSLGTARILTAVSAVLAPQSANGPLDIISRRAFCDMMGINRQSKYVEAGFRNRALYETYLDLEGEIAVGERVSCRASPEGIFSRVDEDGTVTIALLPFGTEKTYPSRAAARMFRCEPKLDSYERDIRFDTTSEFVKETIESFFRRHVPIAPNKKSIAQRRHPLYPSQVEKKQCMF